MTAALDDTQMNRAVVFQHRSFTKLSREQMLPMFADPYFNINTLVSFLLHPPLGEVLGLMDVFCWRTQAAPSLGGSARLQEATGC